MIRIRLVRIFIILAMFVPVVATLLPLPDRAHAQGIDMGKPEELSPEQQLADRYAPITYLKRQEYSCDPTGEAYLPLPINAVMDDPSVILRLDTGGRTAAHDRIVTTGPSMVDLAWLGEGYYLDFPGNPLQPGCYYEHWAKTKASEYEPTVYAHIATEEGVEGLALQYWLFWVFNDFNNRHEGDWEMIQLTFTASTVEEALGQSPDSVTYAQHGGAERTSWDEGEVRREGSHPIIYSAAGSHASYYDDRIFLGWGPGGTGFGCDDTTGPGRRVPLKVVLVPDRLYEDNTFAWLLFRGRWGEKQTWEYNGPLGPQRGTKWNEPISWIETVRERSLYVPETFSLGPTPSSVFCTVTEAGAKGLMFFTVSPKRTAALLVALFSVGVYLFVSLRKSLVRAARLYFAYWGSFSTVGMVLVPLGLALTSLQHTIMGNPPGKWVVDLIGRSEESRLAFSLLLGGAPSLVVAIFIGPATVALIQMLRAGEPTDAGRALRLAWRRIPQVFRTYLRVNLAVLLRVVTLIGIPLAIRDQVRWTFFTQAVMIEDAESSRGAMGTSAAAVSGRWWRSFMEFAAFSLIGLVPGPLVGIVLMVTLESSIQFVHVLSGVIYAISVPYSIIGLTLWYLDLTGRPLSPNLFRVFRKPRHLPMPGTPEPQPEGTAS